MRNLSIKWRLALQFTLVVFLMTLVADCAIFVMFIGRGTQDVDTLLYVQYESLKTNLPITIDDISAPDWRDKMYEKIDLVKSLGFYVVITDSSGTVFDHSSALTFPLPHRIGYSSVQNGQGSERLYRGVYGPYVIVLGRDLTSLTEAQNILLSVLLLTITGTLFLAALLSAMFAGRALRPLTRFSRDVRAIDPQHLPDSTLASQFPDDEIGQLAATFDEFLRRLDGAFKRERQFTQDASHELRTPLMVMRSSLELLSANGKVLTAPQKEKVTLMQSAIARMETLVEELLVLSRGMQSGKRERVMVAALLKDLMKTYSVVAEDKGLTLDLTIHNDVMLTTHRTALEKVIGNLIKNAIRFTQTGGVTLELTGKSLVITDTGIGIASKDLSHIFERFYRADSSRHMEGTGLGLAICKDICDVEAWTIEVESEVGKGSRFTVGF